MLNGNGNGNGNRPPSSLAEEIERSVEAESAPPEQAFPPAAAFPEEFDPEEQRLGRRKLLIGAGAILAASGAVAWALWKPVSDALEAAARRRNKYTAPSQIVSPPVSEEGVVSLPFSEFPRLGETRKPYSVRVSREWSPRWVLVWREPGRPGEIRAISQVCTHASCPVELKSGQRPAFFCSCHGSEFGPRGEVAKGPARLPLAKVELEADPLGVRLRLSKA